MKLIKVRDNRNRPVSGLDLIMSAVFDGSVPREFISGEYYKLGEHVYHLNENGILMIYQCNVGGYHLRCEEPTFSIWSLENLIEKYQSAITDITKLKNDPILYESKSIVAPAQGYEEYDGKAIFTAKADGFDLNEYQGPHDIVDVYLRREHSDSYLAPKEYKFDGTYLTAELPLSDMVLMSTTTTNFFPGGKDNSVYSKELKVRAEEFPNLILNIDGRRFNIIAVYDDDDGEIAYWYGEESIEKSFPYTEEGINLVDYDILESIGKPIDFGYKICDLKIEAVHTVIESQLNKLQAKQIFRLDEIDILGNHTKLSSDIDGKIQTVTIPVVVDPFQKITDELYVTLNTDTQLITVTCRDGYIKQVKFSLTAKKLKPLSAYIIGSKAKSDITKFIRVKNAFGEVVTIDNKKYVKVPYYHMLKYNSYDFELYVNRIFTARYERFVNEDGELFVKLLDEKKVDYDNDVFLFHIFYTISQNALITRTSDEQLVEDDKDVFRIFLTTEFINKFQWLKLREDFKLLPPDVVVGSKNTANIIDPDYYLEHKQTLRADVFSLNILNIDRRMEQSTISCNSEMYPILDGTKNITIPFLDYDTEKDDFLLFKSGGVLMSSSKWYLNGDQVNLYAHEYPFVSGDFVDFRLLDRDETVRIYNRFITIKNTENISVGVDTSNVAFLLLFTMSGQFISPSKYHIEGDKLIFHTNCNQPFEVTNGERLELIYGSYKYDYCRTKYTTLQVVATENDQKEFTIDDRLDFNTKSDNVLIFREDGMYVGEKFYHMDESQDKIIIDKGTGLKKGSHLDIVVIRNLPIDVPV